MRLVTLAFATADDFLAAYHPADGGTLSTRTRTDGAIGERVLLEVSFPGLPNRALVRADVSGIAHEHGLRFAIASDDASTRDFLVAIAHGEVRVDFDLLVNRELELIGSRGKNAQSYRTALRLLADGRIDAESFISEVLPLEEWRTGLELVGQGRKVVFEVGGSSLG